jgi:proline iminopeptidase
MKERWIQSAGAQIWTTENGAGTALLLFNGGPGCGDYLAPVSAMLEDRCRVIRFEPRGCGRSSWDGNYGLDTLLEDAEAIRRAYGVERWILGGHSAGPCFALASALRHPERTLGIIGIAGGSVVDDREWSRVYHERLENEGEERGGIEHHVDTQVNPVGVKTWRAYIKEPLLLRRIAALQVPAVFINSENDIRPNWPTQQLAYLLPRGRYVCLPGAAHYAWLTHPVDLRRELTAALDYIGV